jgi:hypothetical protein
VGFDFAHAKNPHAEACATKNPDARRCEKVELV